ncbi:MAG: hypothetical protein Q8880_09085 [Bacteroidota bacterium]|nr:hypothetical protein [Bacteroidota bacterium]
MEDKTNMFKVPDDYFDNLPTIIQGKCISKLSVEKTFFRKLFVNYNYKVSIISLSILLLVSTGIIFLRNNFSDINIQRTEQIADSSYFNEFDDVDENSLIDLLAENTSTTTTGNNNLQTSASINSKYNDNEVIVNYLTENDNDIDIQEIATGK